MLEDETKTGFKLVVDGYLQNEQAVNKLNLQDLALGPHKLIFIMNDGEKLRRQIDLDQASHYQYVLHHNFQGETKLRFRGSYASLKQSAMVLDFNTNMEYQDLQEAVAVVDSLAKRPALEKPKAIKVKPEPTLPPDSAIVSSTEASSVNTKAAKPSIAAVNEPTKTLDSSAKVQTINIENRQANGFSALQKSIKLNSFEFDKIQMIEEFLQAENINPSQLETLLKELKYDQSRLQILKAATTKQADLKKDKELFLATLDYELSRQKAETFFHESK